MRPSLALALLLLLLLAGAGAWFLTRAGPLAPAALPGQAQESAPAARAPAQVRLESESERTEAGPGEREVPAAPVEPASAAEDLVAEGKRRGWQLPFGKGWWTDALINEAAMELDEARIQKLQQEVLDWGDKLLALKLERKKRLDAYCQERIAAGLAVMDPDPEAVLGDDKQHVIIVTHTLESPNQPWRVDIGPGDDRELDSLDQRIASTWCLAVRDLRRKLAASKP
ncbi:MAG: hypothetical protein IPJ19_09545 [Planctomycetes bacterium]|nr:hypothetical protein [Planctomycetota bacterium]